MQSGARHGLWNIPEKKEATSQGARATRHQLAAGSAAGYNGRIEEGHSAEEGAAREDTIGGRRLLLLFSLKEMGTKRGLKNWVLQRKSPFTYCEIVIVSWPKKMAGGGLKLRPAKKIPTFNFLRSAGTEIE